jgi:endonuclease/exonuclease/phosphatase (EEP) superfamily protein YafD
VAGFAEPQVTVAVMVGAHELRITNVHLLPPVGRMYFAEQRAGAKRLAQWASDSTRVDRPDVLLGDFNAPPRTGIAAAMGAAGLVDAQGAAGWWRGTTWPRVGSLAWVPGLRLDHVFLRDTVECVEIRVGEDFGSDHRPVIAKLRWR